MEGPALHLGDPQERCMVSLQITILRLKFRGSGALVKPTAHRLQGGGLSPGEKRKDAAEPPHPANPSRVGRASRVGAGSDPHIPRPLQSHLLHLHRGRFIQQGFYQLYRKEQG